MDPVASLAAIASHVATSHELFAAGVTPRALSRAVRSGEMMRLRRGCYALPDVDRSLRAAVSLGGVVTCVSELRRHGIWLPHDAREHVAVAPNSSRLLHRSPHMVVHWMATSEGGAISTAAAAQATARTAAATARTARSAPRSSLRHTPALALAVATRCLHPDFAVAAIDSALHSRLCTLGEVQDACRRIPSARRDLLQLVDARSESGLESLARIRLSRAGFAVRSQVSVPAVGRVDLVVGDRVAIELDGRAYHSDETAFAEDRRRDLELTRRGFTVVRLTYRQVMHGWPAVERSLATIIRVRRVARKTRIPASVITL